MERSKLLILWTCLVLYAGLFSAQAFGNPKLLGSGLLVPKDDSWLGADGAISIPLGEKLRLWLFGDTWLRSRDGSLKMISNSVGIQEGECWEPFQPRWGEEDLAAMQPLKQKQGWLWPAGGILLQEGLFLIFHHLERSGSGPWDFRVLGSELLHILNPRAPPSQWEMRRVELPWPQEEFLAASSPIGHERHILLFAVRRFGDDRRLFLARIQKESFVNLEVQAGWEFWAGNKAWTPFLEEAEPLFEGVGTELSMALDSQTKAWRCVYSPGGISAQTLLRRAPAPQGPWGPAQPLYTCPEATEQSYYCYGAKLHPECSSFGLWITYSVNSQEGGFPGQEVAQPRWVLLEAP